MLRLHAGAVVVEVELVEFVFVGYGYEYVAPAGISHGVVDQVAEDCVDKLAIALDDDALGHIDVDAHLLVDAVAVDFYSYVVDYFVDVDFGHWQRFAVVGDARYQRDVAQKVCQTQGVGITRLQ